MRTASEARAPEGTATRTPWDGHLLLDLADVGAQAAPLVGGKAANLGRLLAGRMPVPGGFCLTTVAYRSVAGTGPVAEAVAALTRAAPDQLAAAAAEVRRVILAAPVPAAVAEAVRSGYRRLCSDPRDGAADDGADAVAVAVRSSATAEDLPDASFAGQQDTYLNEVGHAAVLAAVRRCWASLWTERAVRYRAEVGIDNAEVSLAVVVQRMVPATVAGVMFTADPVTGHRGHTVVDASPGLGEAVVSGMVNPDHFVLETATGQLLHRQLGDKAVLVLATPGGGTERAANPGGADAACLDAAQLARLVELGARVEALFGCPQDTEFALDADGGLWLTQARPVTTLYPLPSAPDDGVTRAYFCASVAWQGLTRPVTPMGLTGLRLATSSVGAMLGVHPADPARGPGAFAEAGMRMFLDLTPALRSASGRRFLPLGLALTDARSVAVVRRLVDDPRFPVTDRRRGVFPRRMVRAGLRHGVPLRIVEALVSPTAARRRIDAMATWLDRATAVADGTPAVRRVAAAEQMIFTLVGSLLARIVPITGVGMAMLGVAGRLAGPAADAETMQGVLRGLPGNVTTEMDLALWRLARKVAGDPASASALRTGEPAELAAAWRRGALPATAQAGLDAFLAAYGHRAVAEVDLGMPRWADDPAPVLATLAGYLDQDDPDRAPDVQFARAAAQAQEQIAGLVAAARGSGGPAGRLRSRLVAAALRRARVLLGLREQAKFYNVLVLARARAQLAAAGAQLAAGGSLAAADDVFFLDTAELRAALEGAPEGAQVRATVAARRAEYRRELRRRRVPQMLLSDGTDPEATAGDGAAADGVLTGTPVSTGLATGRARVVHDPVGVRLEPGEILVAPSTDPGWTPLFLTAGALVMETGGVNSHGAVVAREYGIPAVVGVARATLELHDGQEITVDGAGGTVTVTT